MSYCASVRVVHVFKKCELRYLEIFSYTQQLGSWYQHRDLRTDQRDNNRADASDLYDVWQRGIMVFHMAGRFHSTVFAREKICALNSRLNVKHQLKGGELSSQFRWFTKAKIELEFLIFFV